MTIRLYDQHSTSFDFNPGASLPFADIAELAAFDDRQISDGGLAHTSTVRSLWIKRVESPAPAGDGITIVATASGDGAWYRMSECPSWATERVAANAVSWYVDSATGDDENEGSVALPLATIAELTRRLTHLKRSVVYTVNVVAAVATSDLCDLSNRVLLSSNTTPNANPSLYFLGVNTVTRTGTISVANQSDPATGATGTQASVTDSIGTAWTPGEFVYFDTGVGFHVLKDMGAGVARVGHMFTPGDPVASTNIRTVAAPTGGYSVVTKTAWSAPITGEFGDVQVIFKNFNFSAIASSNTISVVGGKQMLVYECLMPNNASAQGFRATVRNLNFNGCLFGATAANFSAAAVATAYNMSLCSFLGCDVVVVVGVPTVFPQVTNCTFQGSGAAATACGCLRVGQSTQPQPGTMTISGWLSFYDWSTTNSAIQIDGESKIVATASTQVNIWGSGGTYGVRVKNGSVLVLPASAGPSAAPYVKLQGSTQDIDLDGLSGANGSATAPMPVPTPGAPSALNNSVALNGANGAGWTAWEASFGRKAISHLTGSKIYAAIS